MNIYKDARQFTADKAWGARNIANIEGASVRLHWTDKPYIWHKNDGSEVFVVLHGVVNMHFREDGKEKIIRLEASDIFTADIGDEHVAKPEGEARILVIEKAGSI